MIGRALSPVERDSLLRGCLEVSLVAILCLFIRDYLLTGLSVWTTFLSGTGLGAGLALLRIYQHYGSWVIKAHASRIVIVLMLAFIASSFLGTLKPIGRDFFVHAAVFAFVALRWQGRAIARKGREDV